MKSYGTRGLGDLAPTTPGLRRQRPATASAAAALALVVAAVVIASGLQQRAPRTDLLAGAKTAAEFERHLGKDARGRPLAGAANMAWLASGGPNLRKLNMSPPKHDLYHTSGTSSVASTSFYARMKARTQTLSTKSQEDSARYQKELVQAAKQAHANHDKHFRKKQQPAFNKFYNEYSRKSSWGM